MVNQQMVLNNTLRKLCRIMNVRRCSSSKGILLLFFKICTFNHLWINFLLTFFVYWFHVVVLKVLAYFYLVSLLLLHSNLQINWTNIILILWQLNRHLTLLLRCVNFAICFINYSSCVKYTFIFSFHYPHYFS